eukprot:5941209-Pyramimonas_sp.AAC.2
MLKSDDFLEDVKVRPDEYLEDQMKGDASGLGRAQDIHAAHIIVRASTNESQRAGVLKSALASKLAPQTYKAVAITYTRDIIR